MSGQKNKNVQVIEAACEGCPINRFNVTNNCRDVYGLKNVLAHVILLVIKFERRPCRYTARNVKECGKCAEACPYNAIADLMRPCKRSCP